ncbi:hypothetical protein [Dyadobacter frigoris]|uniref:hypothetical protein n=1 Tax=Dyadobacter frigoris TaxID=2576211 RepID=UPI001C7091FB|nr:hypothetical protein [Dyadobacter frigoris]
MESLGKEKQIIVYFRGWFCVYADEVVQHLIGMGFSAVRLEDGFPDWVLQQNSAA